jgi:hypothetical protein
MLGIGEKKAHALEKVTVEKKQRTGISPHAARVKREVEYISTEPDSHEQNNKINSKISTTKIILSPISQPKKQQGQFNQRQNLKKVNIFKFKICNLY